MVNVALDNAPLSACNAGDANGDGQITVDDVIVAVNNALARCPERLELRSRYPRNQFRRSEWSGRR